MINLNDHIVEVDGKKFIPLEVAQAAVATAYSENKLDEAMSSIQAAVKEINNSINEALEGDDQDSA